MDQNAKKYLYFSLYSGYDSRDRWRRSTVFKKPIRPTIDSKHRNCFGICRLLFVIPKELNAAARTGALPGGQAGA
jgi:hypothetical protein